jgi:hypothetical protein
MMEGDQAMHRKRQKHPEQVFPFSAITLSWRARERRKTESLFEPEPKRRPKKEENYVYAYVQLHAAQKKRTS